MGLEETVVTREMLIRAGVTAVITNDPDRALKIRASIEESEGKA